MVLNAGSGAQSASALPVYFDAWRQFRVDIDPSAQPDLIASIADLSSVPDGSMDAVWASHCLEHLFAHEVPSALREFKRVLHGDGFACIIVPDLQAIADWIANDRLYEPIYESAAGPVTAHDMIWGFGPAIEQGAVGMAHLCGFTPTPLLERLDSAGFGEIVLRRRNTLEIAALALPRDTGSSERRDALVAALPL